MTAHRGRLPEIGAGGDASRAPAARRSGAGLAGCLRFPTGRRSIEAVLLTMQAFYANIIPGKFACRHRGKD
ncbi:MAG: hypothetical protein OEW98_12110, partial [Betaproteobacteria bacterium]|nr:hypothetical protein [Betaproteobacteria bacterium]